MRVATLMAGTAVAALVPVPVAAVLGNRADQVPSRHLPGNYYVTVVTDNTHFSSHGAARMADLVVQGVREQNLSLVGYLR